MNFLSKRKLSKSQNPVVRLAILHFDRPTDLKEALLRLNLEPKILHSNLRDSIEIVRKFPLIGNDIRLAYLRAVCSHDSSNYAAIVTQFPELLNDSRAVQSIELYKTKTLNQFLGIEEEIEEELPTNPVYTFDDSMFEYIDYTQFETKFDDDFGLIEFATQKDRTLNQLRDRIQNLIHSEGFSNIRPLLQEIQKYLLKGNFTKRTTGDFFVASLRTLGEIDFNSGIEYGKMFFSAVPDHRGMRSMVVFLRRKGDYLDALKLLHHPNFKHDEKTVEWVNDLNLLHKEMLLEGKLKPKYDQFGQDWTMLEEYMVALFESMDHDIEIARYNYGYALKAHKSNSGRPLSEAVIKWGLLILIAAKTYSDTVSIHVSNAFINLGDISSAIDTLEKYGNPKSARISSKIKGYNDLLNLKDKGFTASLEPLTGGYDPIPNRVLYVLHNSLPYNSGGYATRGHGLMCGVKKMGWDVHVTTRRGYPHDRKGMDDLPIDPLQVVDGIPYHRLIELERGYGQINIASYLNAYAEDLVQLVQEIRPSIIHAASNHLNGLVANVVAKHFSIPSIYEVRGLWEITRISRQPVFEGSEYFQMMSNLEATSASEADYLFAITHALGDEMKRRSRKITEVGFLPNGVHSNRFVPKQQNSQLKSKLGIHPDAVVLGYIGSLVSYEGLDLLLEALPLIKANTKQNFKVLIVGDGAYMGKLQTLCEHLRLEDHVIFTGRVPHEEVEDYYSIVDIAPFPRLPLPVTEMVSPLKPFEAMAMEKAVIASSVDALLEIVDHNHTGLIFEKGSKSDLASKLVDLIDDRMLRKKLGEKARIWVCENRDWSSISGTLGEIYSRLGGKVES
ncbi:glycosyltransferase family 4 protein [Candidatus Poseidoniales archaeon]|nr:glycosyltransferase family 4 protein [Candidatus Poseidoniales archaeon]